MVTYYRELDYHGIALPLTYPEIRSLGRYNYDDALSSVRCDFIGGLTDHP
jgi:hypothetical protein